MKIGFMTFVCPEWTIDEVVRFARKAHYDGVEIRVDAGHKHDVSSQSSPQTRRSVKSLFDGEGVEVACIATSVALSSPDPIKRRENVDSAKANLDLAADLGAKVIRTFAGPFVPAVTPEVADYLAAAYDELGEYAEARGVCPMLESGHDIIKSGAEAAEVIRRVKTANFGVLWNYSEMDAATFEHLRPRLRHFHVHDEVFDPKNDNILRLARQVKPIDFHGYVSLEVIKGHNLPEDELTETARRLRDYIAQVH